MSMRFRIPLWAEVAAAILAALAISNLATILFFQIEGERRWQRFGDEFLGERADFADSRELQHLRAVNGSRRVRLRRRITRQLGAQNPYELRFARKQHQ